MNVTIEFPFELWSKQDLIEFCYGKNAQVDSLPVETVRKIQQFTGRLNDHHFYVMDYTKNKIGGEVVNLKEKFFEKVAESAIKQEKTLWSRTLIRNH